VIIHKLRKVYSVIKQDSLGQAHDSRISAIFSVHFGFIRHLVICGSQIDLVCASFVSEELAVVHPGEIISTRRKPGLPYRLRSAYLGIPVSVIIVLPIRQTHLLNV
jgi:hypothetical protein